jgi:hypothetical protein
MSDLHSQPQKASMATEEGAQTGEWCHYCLYWGLLLEMDWVSFSWLLPAQLIHKGPRPFFSKKHPKSTHYRSRRSIEFFKLFFIFNHRILPYITRRTCAKSFTNVDYMDCEFIKFEVQRKVFSLVPGKDNKVWPPLVQNFWTTQFWGFAPSQCTSC